MNAKRIAIVGISGSGKSVLGRKLAEKTGLPLIHMDPFFWRGKWEAIPEVEYLAKHAEVIQGEKWIIEGWIDVKMAARAKLADTIIWLDYSGPRCAWQCFKRWLFHRKEARPELPHEAKEKLDWPFLWMVFKGDEKQDVEDALKGIDRSKILRAENPKEMREIIEKL